MISSYDAIYEALQLQARDQVRAAQEGAREQFERPRRS